MDFTEKDLRYAIARCQQKASRQRDALATTQLELKLWEDLLVKQTPKK